MCLSHRKNSQQTQAGPRGVPPLTACWTPLPRGRTVLLGTPVGDPNTEQLSCLPQKGGAV